MINNYLISKSFKWKIKKYIQGNFINVAIDRHCLSQCYFLSTLSHLMALATLWEVPIISILEIKKLRVDG